MSKRHIRKRRPDPIPFTIRVEATSVYISQMGPGINRQFPEGEASSSITIEGEADPPVKGSLRKTLITIFCNHRLGEDVGASIGATGSWQVVVRLPRDQFTDLLTIALSQRLATAHLVFDEIKRGRGTVRSAYFYTTPVPIEQENEVADR